MKIFSKINNQFFFIYSAFWLFLITVYAILLNQLGVLWNSAIFDALFSFSIMIVFSFFLNNIIKYYQPGPKNIKNVFIWCFVFTLFWHFLTSLIIPYFVRHDLLFTKILNSSISFRFLMAYFILTINVLINWMYRLFETQKLQNSRDFNIKQLAKDAELQSLRQQMQPHFLFNSLNSISSLAVTKPHKAREMIQQLSDFLRGTLLKNQDQFIDFSKEIDHLKLYLEIEKVRFGHRLNFLLDIHENTLSLQIPALVLQPVLENAIKFGLYDTLDLVNISIHSKFENNELIVTVSNPFDPETSYPVKGTGFGISSLNRRLFLLFNRNNLVTTNHENMTFFTIITIPINESHYN